MKSEINQLRGLLKESDGLKEIERRVLAAGKITDVSKRITEMRKNQR